MDIKLIAIPLTFVMMATVLCWCLVVMRGDWRRRLTLIVILPALSLLVWYAMPSYMGWPASVTPPEKVVLLWADIREPNKRTGDPGALYLWAVGYDEATSRKLFFVAYPVMKGEPRAYVFPYSRRGHEILVRAKGRIADGRPVILEMLGGFAGEQEGERGEGDPSGGRHQRQRGPGYEDEQFRMYELPGASFPPKDE